MMMTMEASAGRRRTRRGWCRSSAAVLVVAMAVLMGTADGCSRVVERRVYARCRDLGAQGASIAYSYERATRRLEVAFVGQAARAGGWVGWGINPSGWGMTGASVLVAFHAPTNGTAVVMPFKLSPAAQAGERLHSGPIDLTILSLHAVIRGSATAILASLRLRPSQSTALNLIWNRGAAVSGFSPLPHSLLPQDLRGFATIDVAA